MERSEDIKEFATAFCKAQKHIDGAIKDAKNPFFKSDYATLRAVKSACMEHLLKEGISVYQGTKLVGDIHLLETMLMHTSGQFISSDTPLILEKKNMQGLKSAVTYARRTALAAAAGVHDEDDDGEGSVDRRGGTGAKRTQNAGIRPAASAPQPAPRKKGAGDLNVISEPQRKRLFAIYTKAGWEHTQVKALIKELAGVDSSNDIPRNGYEEIVDHIQANPPPAKADGPPPFGDDDFSH